MNIYFTVIALFILRVLVGFTFLFIGWSGVQRGKTKDEFGVFALPQAPFFSEHMAAWIFVIIGFALTLGIFTRIAAIVGIAVLLASIGSTIRHRPQLLAQQLLYLALFFLFIATNAGMFIGYGDIMLRFPYVQQLYGTTWWFSWML